VTTREGFAVEMACDLLGESSGECDLLKEKKSPLFKRKAVCVCSFRNVSFEEWPFYMKKDDVAQVSPVYGQQNQSSASSEAGHD